MAWGILQSVWPVLAILAYLCTSLVLFVLASHHGRGIAIHDRLRESKALRQRYLQAMRSKKEDH